MAWASRGEIEDVYRALADRLMAAGVREPERVAVTSRGAAESSLGRPADGWHVFYVEEIGDGIDPVVESLRKEG